jgi:putative ABC transport system permease protein
MGMLLQDIRYGWRMLAKTPALTVVVAITLALGIGANVLIFSFVNGFLLRPMPVPHPEQIAVLAGGQQGTSQLLPAFSYPDFVDFRQQADSFADLIGYALVLPGLSADGRADRVLASCVSGNYFPSLGVKPALGRLILGSEENQPGEQPVVVLGYSYWKKRFGGNPGVIGKQVRVNGQQARIIGVVPRQFQGVISVVEMDIYMPLGHLASMMEVSSNPLADRSARVVRVLARLKPGVSFSQAQASVDVIASRLAKQYPSSDSGLTVRVYREQLARPQPLGNNLVVVIASFFLILALLLLLLACMNVANILLARATVRQREMGLRAALGAGRGRLISQMLTESIMLGLLGGLLGLILGEWVRPADILKAAQSSLPVRLDFSLDWHVFAYSFAATLFSGIFVGLWPALRASRADLNTILQEGGRSDSAGSGRNRLRGALVVAQVAGSLMLLVIAGLFVRSLRHAETMYVGFDPDHMLTLSMDPQQIGYDQARTADFYRQLEARAGALPGVQSASLAYGVPMTGNVNAGTVTFDGQTLARGQQPLSLFFDNVEPAYFETMRVPLLRGRAFTEADNQAAPPVVIVNQTMADKYWPHQDPIGKHFSLKTATGSAKTLQIVGLAGNGKYLFIAEDPTPFFYVPLAQNYTSARTLVVRSSVPPERLLAPVQAEIHKLAPDLPVADAKTMKQALGDELQEFRLGAGVAAAMGAIGLILAVIGLYGIVSFSAVQRTREIGIRMALGGTARDVLGLILRQGIRMVILGLAVGVLAALGITRVMTGILIGVSPNDPVTFVAVALLLAAIALAACWIPARRATRVDPGVALRYE